MGRHQLQEFLDGLPHQVRSQVFKQPVEMSFRFGNNSVVQEQHWHCFGGALGTRHASVLSARTNGSHFQQSFGPTVSEI